MFQPFVWMFKAEGYGKSVLQLFGVLISLTLLSALLFFSINFVHFSYYAPFVMVILSILAFLSIALIFQGYFWEVTNCVINREVSLEANNIYSGKIKKNYIVTLPEFKIFKLWWRGVASSFASVLLVLPYLLLVYTTLFTGLFCSPLFNGHAMFWVYIASYTALLIFYFVSMPAVFWNYAAKNSVTAVWELRRIIYLMESYPGKYILNSVLFAIVYLLNAALIYGVKLFLISIGLDDIYVVLIQTFIGYIISFYLLYVYAYLLGTIVPPEEA